MENYARDFFPPSNRRKRPKAQEGCPAAKRRQNPENRPGPGLALNLRFSVY